MSEALLRADGVSRWYQAGRAGLSGERRFVQAVTEVDLEVQAGETVAIIGESGCGKSTLGRTLLGLEPLTAGAIYFDGRRISGLADRQLRSFRRDAQMVWQNAASAVNRRRRIGHIIREPLDAHGIADRRGREDRVRELLDMVNLPAEMAGRFPHELSGGQLQRVGIARALALTPRLLVCDEPTAALDVSVRAQIVNLIVELQERLGLTVVYISHDIRTVRVIADRVAIMYLGRVVERARSHALDSDSLSHPYARALMDAVPQPDPEHRRGAPPIAGEVASPLAPPPGCPYHPRCPLRRPVCLERRPVLEPTTGGDSVACHAVGGGGHARWNDESPLVAVGAEAP